MIRVHFIFPVAEAFFLAEVDSDLHIFGIDIRSEANLTDTACFVLVSYFIPVFTIPFLY